MGVIELLFGAICAVLAAAAGGFGLGHIRGAGKAEAKARQKRTEENAVASVAAAEHKVEATVRADNVQEAVKRMSYDAVDRELRKNFTRPGSR